MLLEVKNLKTYFYSKGMESRAVDGVSFSIEKGKILGIVGESGCGKSVTSMSVMRLIDPTMGKIVDGEILFEGKDLAKLSEKEMIKIRGNEISMIFQEPMTSLNPVFTVGYQIMEAIRTHQNLNKKEARAKCLEMLKLVKIPDPERVIDQHPHKLSGGMRQRVMIAMALSCNPKLLIADEPTTALDVTIQAQVLTLMKELQKRLNTGIILITHDLGVVAEMADEVLVMYTGTVVERGDIKDIFKNPLHPYTVGLMNSKPNILKEQDRLFAIRGNVPSLYDMPEGCPFHPRCEHCMEICKKKRPVLAENAAEPGHAVSCWLYQKQEAEGGDPDGKTDQSR